MLKNAATGWRATIVAAGLVAILAVPAWGQPSLVKWSQPPDPAYPTNVFYGWNEESTYWDLGPTVADDFVCANNDPIVHVRWWGSFLGWKEAYPPPASALPWHFHILFWTDVPADAADPNSFSHPGRVVHEIVTLDGTYNTQFVGWDYDPRTGEYESCFVFDQVLEPWQWFYQEPTGDPGIYWISIAACYGGVPPTTPNVFGWKTRPRVDSLAPDDAVVITQPHMPMLGSAYLDGYPLEYPEGTSWDMAFELVAQSMTPSVKWQQPPDPQWPGLHAHDSTSGRIILADQWQCEGGQVTDFHWYGNYEMSATGGEIRGAGIDHFHLSIHRNVPVLPWCLPQDPEMWGVDVPFGAITEEFTGLINNEGSRIYRYTYYLPTPFDQVAGEIYWLDITAVSVDLLDPPMWRWQEAGRNMTPILCPAAWMQMPGPTGWQSIGWATMTWTDLAFDVTSTFLGELYIKWSQSPQPYTPENAYNGWDEYSVYGGNQIAADDWVCTTDAPVTDIHWWGSFIGWYYAEPPQMPAAFHFTIWTDGTCTDPDTGATFSCPQQVLWEADCDTYAWEFVGWDFDPRLPLGAPPEATFKFSCDLSDAQWFYQDAGNNIYWLSIAAVYDTGTDPPYPFGWKTRPRDPDSAAPDDGVRIFDPTAPHMGDLYVSGQPIYWPDPTYSWDLAFELTGQAQPPPRTYAKWKQPPTENPLYPGYFYGWNEPSEYYGPQLVADDWNCKDYRSVSDIHWWGSYLGWASELPPLVAPVGFHIGLWTDVPVGDPNNPFTWSHPGQMIRQWTVARRDLNERAVGMDFYPPNLLETCFRYDFAIPQSEWFRQPGREQIFWISIAAIYPTGVPTDPLWGWKTRQPHWNDDAVRIFAPIAPLPGDIFLEGLPIENADGSWDMAFLLTTPHCLGDANCDGKVDFADINAFVDAIVYGIYCDESGVNCDMTQDDPTHVGFEDINPFVTLLTTNPLPIWCP